MKKIAALSFMLFSTVQGAELTDRDEGKELTAYIRVEVNRVLENFQRNMNTYYARTGNSKRISIIPMDTPAQPEQEPEDHPDLKIPQTPKEDMLREGELEKTNKFLTSVQAQQNLETARNDFEKATRWLQMCFSGTDYDYNKYNYRREGITDKRTSDQKETDIRRYKLILNWPSLLDVARAKQEFIEAANEVTRKSSERRQSNLEEPADVSSLKQKLEDAEKYLKEELNIQKPTLLQITVIDELKAFMKPQSGKELTPKAVKLILERFILHAIWNPIGDIVPSILTEINRQDLDILSTHPEDLKDKVDLGLQLKYTRKEKFGFDSIREVTIFPDDEKITRAISLVRETLKERRSQYLKDHTLDGTKGSLEEYEKYMDKARFWAILHFPLSNQETLDAAIEADKLLEQHGGSPDYNLHISNIDRADALLYLQKNNLIDLTSDQQIKDAVTHDYVGIVAKIHQERQKLGNYSNLLDEVKEKLKMAD